MMEGEDRRLVVENIRNAVQRGDFYAKVELHDPQLSPRQSRALVRRYLENRKKASFRIKTGLTRVVVNILTRRINRSTEIDEQIDGSVLKNGAIITSNHFGPLENTVIRHYVRSRGKRRLHIVSQVTNFAMTGKLGVLMNYADTIPLPTDAHQLLEELPAVLSEKLQKKDVVLIYPEQEMWWNYRKPRPPKRGAYYFAARLGCPVVSCFVEILDCPEAETKEICKTRYRLHVLDVLYPDREKSVRENSEWLCRRDYALKKEAYQRCYGKTLSYDFEAGDIAGWKGSAYEE